ncbi:MAG: phosphoribosyl-ATP diphosphatase [Anaerolineaceae bacterium]|nr:phosphoribosyl-ATP diphosphatase [Anaerolineaceae bacterium]
MQLQELYDIIADRKVNPVPDSYTCFLFEKGMEEISKKLGEESIEVILAANQQTEQRTVEEISDLLYHLLVLMVARNIPLSAIENELAQRHQPKS